MSLPLTRSTIVDASYSLTWVSGPSLSCGRDGQPLVRADAQLPAVAKHRIDERILHGLGVQLVRIPQRGRAGECLVDRSARWPSPEAPAAGRAADAAPLSAGLLAATCDGAARNPACCCIPGGSRGTVQASEHLLGVASRRTIGLLAMYCRRKSVAAAAAAPDWTRPRSASSSARRR